MLLPQRARRGTTGGVGGVREGCDTVKAWSRGAETFLLVARLFNFFSVCVMDSIMTG
jgi:hypothetical protein